MSALAFGPEGVLFVGDATAGAIFAIDLGDNTRREGNEPLNIRDVETQIAARLVEDVDT